MPTLKEICKDYGVDLNGFEKTAEEKCKEDTTKSAVEKMKEIAKKETEKEPKKEDKKEEKKEEKALDKKGGMEMATLKDLWESLNPVEKTASVATPAELDEETLDKIAAAEADELLDLEKIAEDEETAGRFMAMGFIDELNKLGTFVGNTPCELSTNYDGPGSEAMTTGPEVDSENDVHEVLVANAVRQLLNKAKGEEVAEEGQDNKVSADNAAA